MIIMAFGAQVLNNLVSGPSGFDQDIDNYWVHPGPGLQPSRHRARRDQPSSRLPHGHDVGPSKRTGCYRFFYRGLVLI